MSGGSLLHKYVYGIAISKNKIYKYSILLQNALFEFWLKNQNCQIIHKDPVWSGPRYSVIRSCFLSPFDFFLTVMYGVWLMGPTDTSFLMDHPNIENLSKVTTRQNHVTLGPTSILYFLLNYNFPLIINNILFRMFNDFNHILFLLLEKISSYLFEVYFVLKSRVQKCLILKFEFSINLVSKF